MERVRIGLIGSGGNMRWHIGEMLKLPEVEIVGIADPSDEQIRRTRLQYPALAEVPVFADYRQMLDQVPMDAVNASTPHTQHADQIRDSFAKGLHVMMEKPLCTTVEDTEDVIAARDASGKVGMVSYQRHVTAEYMFIRDEIQSGRYGKVLSVSANLMQDWKRGTTGSWRQDPALSGGGMFLDSGSHMLDQFHWLTDFEPEIVCAFVDNRGTPVDINAVVSVKGRRGEMGTINIMGDVPGWSEELFVYCEDGAFFIHTGKLSIRDRRGFRRYEYLEGGRSPDKAFVDTILGRSENPSPFEAALKVMKLTQAAYDSAAQGGIPVRIT